MAQSQGSKGGSFRDQNPFQQSSGQLAAANSGYAHGMFYNPTTVSSGANSAAYGGGAVTVPSGQFGYNAATATGIEQPAGSYTSAQLANTDLSSYMNPYTNDVINASMADMERARQTALNNTGAQASAAGAFGGGRHALMEARTNSNAIDDMGRLSANLRAQGFQNAQNMALADIANQNQASQFNIGTDQNQRMANLQNRQYNAGVQNQASQFEQQANLQTALQNAANRQQSGILARQIASNERLADQRADQWAAQFRLGAADRMANLGLSNFSLGQQVQAGNQAQGQFERALQQGILDRAMQQYQGYQQAPYQGMDVLNSAFNPAGQGTQSSNPGLFDYLGAGLGAAGLFMATGGGAAAAAPAAAASDMRLKDGITRIGEWMGHNLYRWTWTQEAVESGLPLGPEVGVIAQEVQQTRPDAVVEHDSGYLMVNYGAL